MSDLNWTPIIEGKGAMLDIGATRLTLTPHQMGSIIDAFTLTVRVGEFMLFKDKLYLEDLDEAKTTALHLAKLALQQFYTKSREAREALSANV